LWPPRSVVVIALVVEGRLGRYVPAPVVARGVVVVLVVAGALVVVRVSEVVVRQHVGEVVVAVRVSRAGLERVLLEGGVAARGEVAVLRSGVTPVDTVAVLCGQRVGLVDPCRVAVLLACQRPRGRSCRARTGDTRRSAGCAHPGTGTCRVVVRAPQRGLAARDRGE